MAPIYQEHSVEQEVAAFFAKASTTRQACDLRAKDLVGGDVILVPVQGVCSYTVYAETVQLAHRVYGSLAPEVRSEGQIGEDSTGREALYVYVMPRMKGISPLDFSFAHGFPKDSPDIWAKRLTLVIDVARFFALSWKSPQKIARIQSDNLRETYENDLQLLLHALPERFRAIIRDTLEALPAIMSLPMVLTHKDFGEFNILVDPETSHLLGVIDWAEAKIEPFGINFDSVQNLMGHFHMRNGYDRYVDYDILQNTFWNTLRDEVGGWSDDTLRAIKAARVLGLLLSSGFTSRLADESESRPIFDDDSGAYNMLHLDSHLIRPDTKFI